MGMGIGIEMGIEIGELFIILAGILLVVDFVLLSKTTAKDNLKRGLYLQFIGFSYLV
jgi:hypothetical protein